MFEEKKMRKRKRKRETETEKIYVSKKEEEYLER